VIEPQADDGVQQRDLRRDVADNWDRVPAAPYGKDLPVSALMPDLRTQPARVDIVGPLAPHVEVSTLAEDLDLFASCR
jgi:hypothetical protein